MKNGLVRVEIGKVCITRPPHVLQTVLGSCIGLVIYDPHENIAGMAHILLPSSLNQKITDDAGRYADGAIACLYDALIKYGAKPQRLQAKFAGGARMFGDKTANDNRDVGQCNIIAVRSGLSAYRIPIIAEDVGGIVGRRAEFYLANNQYIVADFANRTITI